MSTFRFRRFTFAGAVLALAAIAVAGPSPLAVRASGTAQASVATATVTPCTGVICSYSLAVNPGLQAGKPFACPAIQHASAIIRIVNRFALHRPNDVMLVTASGLPPNTGFDLFTAQNSPVDAGTFPGFGFAWYQSDLESDANGNASVAVQGIFDKETFIQAPFASGTTAPPPIHTYNVGFWFNSPTEEQRVCGNAKAPGATPFNGEQNAGLLAMITAGEPLQAVQ